ncbi:MAG: hypothetical protein IPK83_14435 [Planctomycetes bacterium]|nr:hypothetical protein [Planctomycetota bacterium]
MASATAIYTITIDNAGPENATSMEYEITFSGSAPFTISNALGQNSTPNVAGSVITGSITPFTNGATEVLTITVDAQGAGTLGVVGTVAAIGNPPDIVQGNNSMSHTAEVKVLPDVELTFTTEPSSPASDVPGLGLKFQFDASSSAEKFRKPFRSGNSQYIALWADTDDSNTDTDEIYIRKDRAAIGPPSREGVTAISICENDRLDDSESRSAHQ